jgi:hypothetical protein
MIIWKKRLKRRSFKLESGEQEKRLEAGEEEIVVVQVEVPNGSQ